MGDQRRGVLDPGSEPRIVRTSDGRRIGYAEFGDPSGAPCLYLHFTPGCRLEPKAIFTGREELLDGVRLIAIDRPGYGASDFQAERSILDWPRDAEAVADELGLERFAVLGASGGGGYATACARALPQRVTVALMVSGMGPYERPEAKRGMSRVNRALYGLSRSAPWLARAMAKLMFRRLAKQLSRPPKAARPDASKPSGPPEWDFMADPRLRGPTLETLRAAVLEPGPNGVVEDLRVYSKPWPFRFEDIEAPVLFWHATNDVNVPIALARYMADRISGSEFHQIDGGHTAPIARIEEPLAVLRRYA